MMHSTDAVLDVADLRTEFRIAGAWHAAVDNVSFALAPRETLALVGESGCGKSVTALSIMGLVPVPQGRIAAGRIVLEGRDLVGLAEPTLEKLRGNRVAMIFQEPMTSLNPVMTIGAQVAEALMVHKNLSRHEANAKALAVLDEVKIPSAAQRFHDYPHQFSGGMRQRVMIAIALACEPALLLADEPTTALDVTIQAQVLGLLADLKDRHGMAMLFITHNLGVVAQIADRVAVMYAGQIVEQAPVSEIFARRIPIRVRCSLRSRAWTAMRRTSRQFLAACRRWMPCPRAAASRHAVRWHARAANCRRYWRRSPSITWRAAMSRPGRWSRAETLSGGAPTAQSSRHRSATRYR
jgi:ABC-type dipeptide/oligopeptide/nickel transport system ATPase component